ncbi:helix-turn-helix domain-containing protein [Intrasporangium calvum]|uniref:Helix-turn-helix domain-containing protein n=1 Tax=Intrasporangium calvum TaxID=53358 RepID=A0ABT5GJY5_9MICO|nr:PucR family transcriptional regulator [Intrasporangium calvum]MDC5697996.1 helix-turn-helix domain-containing protein [Intrasporangium calvum]
MSLPAEIGEVLRPVVGEVVEAIIDGIPRDVPVYAMPLEGRFGQGVRQGVTVALNRFLDLPGTRLPALSEDGAWIYENLGRGEVRSGRSLESLLSAYRYGARVTLRAISRTVDVSQLAPDVILALGESLFAYIDELSAVSAQGYALEQSERAGEHQRRRGELLEMILRGDPETGVTRAATALGWTLPEVLVVATLPPSRLEGVRAALGPDALVAERGTEAAVIMPIGNRTARARELNRALRGRQAIIGPERPWQQAAESLHLAVSAAAHGLGGPAGEGDLPVWVEDHLAELVVHAEPLATADLARRRLAPLDGLRPAVRARLVETLLAWLRHQGQRAPIAAELFVHQQTVGYRVGQLKELFGEAFDDPEARFELELVLRAGHR